MSSVLLELGELEGFLLSWPGPSESFAPGSSSENIPLAVAEASLAIALKGIYCDWLWCKQIISCVCIMETKKPLKNSLDSARTTKMKNIDQKNHFLPQRWFSSNKNPWSLRGTNCLHRDSMDFLSLSTAARIFYLKRINGHSAVPGPAEPQGQVVQGGGQLPRD